MSWNLFTIANKKHVNSIEMLNAKCDDMNYWEKGHKHKAHEFIKVENEVLVERMVTLSFCIRSTNLAIRAEYLE